MSGLLYYEKGISLWPLINEFLILGLVFFGYAYNI